MPFDVLSGKVKQGTLCWADKWAPLITIVGMDCVPLNDSTPLFVDVRWTPAFENGEVQLVFRMIREGQDTRICFDTVDGETSKTLVGNQQSVFNMFGRSIIEISEPDIFLDVIVDGKTLKSFPMSVGTIDTTLSISLENEVEIPTSIIPADIPTAFKAKLSSPTAGSYQWLSLDSGNLQITGSDEGGATVVAHSSEHDSRWLFIKFIPGEGVPSMVAMHQVGMLEGGITGLWTKNLDPITRDIRSGEVIEAYATVENQAFRLDQFTQVMFGLIPVAESAEPVAYILGPGVTVAAKTVEPGADAAQETTEPAVQENRNTHFLSISEDSTLKKTVDAFKLSHAADYYEQALIVEEKTENDGLKYHIITWWKAAIIGTADKLQFTVNISDRLQGGSDNNIQLLAEEISPPEIMERIPLKLSGRLIDAHPLKTAVADIEPLDDVNVEAGGQSTATSLFSVPHLKNPASLAKKLRDQATPATKYLFSVFHPPLRNMLAAFKDTDQPSQILLNEMIKEFNLLIQGDSFFVEEWFSPSPQLQSLIDQNPRAEALLRLNRMVLEEALSGELYSRNPGEILLQGNFVLDENDLIISREGVDTFTLKVNVSGNAADGFTVKVSNPDSNTDIVTITHFGALTDTPVEVPLADVRVVVHKIRGTVCWPDSRVINDPKYSGTPLYNKRVYVLPLKEDEKIDKQRLKSSTEWAKLKNGANVLYSGRPGKYLDKERTDYNGQYEVKYVDLSLGKKYFIWVESHFQANGTGDWIEAPETIVRTRYKTLRRLNGANAFSTGRMDTFVEDSYHIVEHGYNLGKDQIKWGVETLAVVEGLNDKNETIHHAAIPSVNEKIDVRLDFDTNISNNIYPFNEDTHGEKVLFDDEKKLLADFTLKTLPLVLVEESPDQQGGYPESVRSRYFESMDTYFERVNATPPNTPLSWTHASNSGRNPEKNFLIDYQNIDVSTKYDEGAWDAGAEAQRRCELLEKTFLLHPAIQDIREVENHSVAGSQPLWDFDTFTLADHAYISVPATPDNKVSRRVREHDVAPLFRPMVPRLTGLIGKRVFLGPGHGFYDNQTSPTAPTTPATTTTPAVYPASPLADWVTTRGGYNLNAGEDQNVGHFFAQLAIMLSPNLARSDTTREIMDFQKPGYAHPDNDVFEISTTYGFPRLWQQNIIYYLGTHPDPSLRTCIIGPNPFKSTDYGNVLNQKRDYSVRYTVAKYLAGEAPTLPAVVADRLPTVTDPIDIILFIHTNATANPATFVPTSANPTPPNPEANSSRGTSVFYCQTRVSTTNAGEANVSGQSFGQRLLDRTVERGRTRYRQNSPVNHKANDVAETFDHWNWGGQRYQQQPAGAPATAQTIFPSGIPSALIEVAFHTNSEDLKLMASAWYRRRIGETLAMAIEEQFLANTGAISKKEVVNRLSWTFGSTDKINALTSDDTEITAAQIQSYVRDATGVDAVAVPLPANNHLTSAVTAIEQARDAFDLEAFVSGLSDSLADMCGYNDAGDIEKYITQNVLFGKRLAELKRRDKPISRDDAASYIALAFGWAPATLVTVVQDSGDNSKAVKLDDGSSKTLMSLLDREEHAEQFLPKVEADKITGTLKKVLPTEIFRISKLYIEDDQYMPLLYDKEQECYVLRAGTMISVVAETEGTPWLVGSEKLKITITNHAGEVVSLAETEELRVSTRGKKIGSAAFQSVASTQSKVPDTFTLSIELTHDTNSAMKITKTEEIKVQTLL